jgi:DNA-binding HxlR family transcriptional regulator
MGNGGGNAVRSGAQTLLVLAAPLNAPVLRALRDGPKQQAELRREAGAPAQTTLRAQLKRLEEIGAIEKRRCNRFPGVLEYELTLAGRDLLFVVDVLERWLELAPEGPQVLGGAEAKVTVKALTDGWSTTIVRALATGPLSLTELDGLIGALSYPSLERRLNTMRLVGLLGTRIGDGRARPYTVTAWLRFGIAPLAAAARWERRHRPHTSPPIAALDVETAFLLTVPMLELEAGLNGSCRLAAELRNGNGRRLAGVTVGVEDGKVVSSSIRLQGQPVAWAIGSVGAWLGAVIQSDRELELGGDCRLARALVDGLHEGLFREQIETF